MAIQVKFLKTVRGENVYEKDKVYSLTKNEAYSYIELGIAKVFKSEEVFAKAVEAPARDKMMRKRSYKKCKTCR